MGNACGTVLGIEADHTRSLALGRQQIAGRASSGIAKREGDWTHLEGKRAAPWVQHAA